MASESDLKMTVDEAIAFADEWSRGMTLHADSQGWRVVCLLLADEVRRLRAPSAEATLLDVAIDTLNQIADRPRNAGARRNARATLRFIETQIDAIAQKAQEVGRG